MFNLCDFLEEGINPGVSNEDYIVGVIQRTLRKQPELTIVFVSGSTQYKLEGIREIINKSKDHYDRKKADFVLLDAHNHEYPISIKTDNGEYWESADSYYGEKARKKIDYAAYNHKIDLDYNVKTDSYIITPQIAIQATPKEANDVIFGNDILPHGAVIKRTFTHKDFALNKDVLIIMCTDIIKSYNEVKNTPLEPYFFIRNQERRNCISLGYKGLRVICMYKSRLSNNILVV